jgi:hypothetical protein
MRAASQLHCHTGRAPHTKHMAWLSHLTLISSACSTHVRLAKHAHMPLHLHACYVSRCVCATVMAAASTSQSNTLWWWLGRKQRPARMPLRTKSSTWWSTPWIKLVGVLNALSHAACSSAVQCDTSRLKQWLWGVQDRAWVAACRVTPAAGNSCPLCCHPTTHSQVWSSSRVSTNRRCPSPGTQFSRPSRKNPGGCTWHETPSGSEVPWPTCLGMAGRRQHQGQWTWAMSSGEHLCWGSGDADTVLCGACCVGRSVGLG